MKQTLIVDLVNKANLVHNLFSAYLFLVYKYTNNKHTKNKLCTKLALFKRLYRDARQQKIKTNC